MARPPRCPALDCSEGGVDEDTRAEVLEAVTDAQDLPGSTPDTAADTGWRWAAECQSSKFGAGTDYWD